MTSSPDKLMIEHVAKAIIALFKEEGWSENNDLYPAEVHGMRVDTYVDQDKVAKVAIDAVNSYKHSEERNNCPDCGWNHPVNECRTKTSETK